MATGYDQLISGLLGGTGFGRTPADNAQQNLQIQGGQQQLQVNNLKIAEAQRQAQQEQAYQQDIKTYFDHPTLEALGQLSIRYPEKADAFKQQYSAMDAKQRQGLQGVYGPIFNAAQNGRADLVIAQLKNVKTAEQAKGVDTTDIDDALTALASDDPKARAAALRNAMGLAQMHLAAIDPAKFNETLSATGKASEGFKLGQGDTQFDSNGNIIASVAPKPDYLVVPEGGKAIPLNGAPALEGGEGEAGGDIVARMIPITLGSEGGGTLANPNVSPKGARGPMQVMPSTNTDPGFGVAPAKDTSEAERARVGRDYLTAMVQRYNDPAKAWAAYNAGPGAVDDAVGAKGTGWLQAMPAETRKYVARNMSQLRRGGQSGGGDPPGTVYGSPKRGYRVLSPQEVPSGLDPNVVYQQGPDGNITPVGGQRQGQLKPWPAPALAARASNAAALKNLDDPIALLDPNNDSPEAQAARGAVGFGTGWGGENMTNWRDPKGTSFRARIGQIGGIIIKDTSGAAVSLSEDERLKKWVPYVTDSPATIREKLLNLRRELGLRNQAMEETYTEDQGYRPFGGGRNASTAPSGPKRGEVRKGYRFTGGDPANRNSWVKVQ